MGLLFRGIVWFGLYVALALAPLRIALLVDPIGAPRPFVHELAVAFGFIAFPLLAAEFALVSRLRAASAPFGTDALMQFHRAMALAACAFALGHALLLAPGSSLGSRGMPSGTAALVLLAALVAASLWRRRPGLSYEAWRLTHLAAALVVVAGSLVHVLAIGRYSGEPLLRGALLLYAGVLLALLLDYRALRPLRLARRPWELLANRDEGADARTLIVQPLGHAGFAFEPGQFVWLAAGRSPLAAEQHPISIASSAERAPDAPLELTIKALGDWSREVVPALRPGARLWLDGPYGAFTSDRAPGQGFVLIAGGIGITPLRSMLLTMRDRGDVRPALLFFAARNFERVVYRAELEALTRVMSLRIVWVFEEPPPDWAGERGFITVEVLRRHLPRQFRRMQYFLCGPVPMMDALEEALAAIGVPRAQIQSERFNVV